MINEDQVVALFIKANPVPSLELLDAIEPVVIDELVESSRLSTVTPITPHRSETWLRLRWVAVLASIAFAISALPMVLSRPMFARYLTTPAEAIAMTYEEALKAKDLATLAEVVAPEAALPTSLDELPGRWEYERVTGWVFPPLGCEEQSTGPDGTLVSCRYLNDGSWMNALGLEPEVGAEILLIQDGRVQALTEDLSNYPLPGVGQAWGAFRNWVLQNHSEDEATMYETVGIPRYTPEAVALWEQYTDEFVAEMEASG